MITNIKNHIKNVCIMETNKEQKPLKIGAMTMTGPMAEGSEMVQFRKDAQEMDDIVNKRWLNKHPERHALVVLFDVQGNVMISDSCTPDEPYDNPTPEVRAHRVMLTLLMTMTDPRLAEDISYYLSALMADVKVRDLEPNEYRKSVIPNWVHEYNEQACDMINERIVLAKQEEK